MVIGDVAKTVPEFFESHNAAPVGFIAIDVDYYSSTVDVLRMFEAPAERMLPRVLCYVDDCIGDDHEIHCEFVGELLAIREFNDSHDQRKIAKIHGLRHKRKIQQPWNDMMFAAPFDHPMYTTHTNPRWTPRVHKACRVTVAGPARPVLSPRPTVMRPAACTGGRPPERQQRIAAMTDGASEKSRRARSHIPPRYAPLDVVDRLLLNAILLGQFRRGQFRGADGAHLRGREFRQRSARRARNSDER